MVNPSPRTLTVGGRAMIPTFGAKMQHQTLHWSLCRSLCYQCQVPADFCACCVTGWSLTLHSSNPSPLFDIRISSGRSQPAACNGPHALSREARHNARFSRGRLCVCGGLVPFTVSKRMCRTARTRALWVKVSMQCLLYIMLDP